VWSRTTSVVVRALVIGSWNCSFVHQSGISKLLFLCMFFVVYRKTKTKRKQNKKKRKENKEKK